MSLASARTAQFCVRNVLDGEWCERMNVAVERLLLNPGKRAREATKAGDPGRFHMNVFMWRWDPDFRELALHSPLPELGATLLGADRVSLFYDQAFIKESGTRSVTDWHQDLPFWPALGNDIVSLWVALTPVTVEGSGVEYVAGSHIGAHQLPCNHKTPGSKSHIFSMGGPCLFLKQVFEFQSIV
jgi:ectoine hydroxylase-related dioxygenase (phytanoyl-CoA dioxygenase family)